MMKRLRWMSSIIVVVMLLLLVGCLSVEERWEKIDEQMQQEIGVKTKDYYLSEWGNPATRVKAADGGSIWTWEFRAYGGAEGWNKILTFRPDGVLKEFRREYWPKEYQ